MLNYYHVLGVLPTATAKEIKSAFRRRVRELHPDLQPNSDRMAFQQVIEAYRVLSEPNSRRQYDLYSSMFSTFTHPHSQSEWPFPFPNFDWFVKIYDYLSPTTIKNEISKFMTNHILSSVKINILNKLSFEIPFFVSFFNSPSNSGLKVPKSEWFCSSKYFFHVSIIDKIIQTYFDGLEAFKQESFQQAEELFLRVVKHYPDFLPSYIALGNIYRKIGKTDKAKKYYKRVYSLDATGINGNLASSYLRSLG